ncbi:MAG: hypothetical protein NUV31_02270 [Dehalococcoidales bacterium]|nr:hypothetical protein [Dehalococcoidales bacterium]
MNWKKSDPGKIYDCGVRVDEINQQIIPQATWNQKGRDAEYG